MHILHTYTVNSRLLHVHTISHVVAWYAVDPLQWNVFLHANEYCHDIPRMSNFNQILYFYLFYNECQNNTMYTQYGYDVLQTMYVSLGRLSLTAKCYMYTYCECKLS